MGFDALLGLDGGMLGIGSRLLIIAFIVAATRLAPFREPTPPPDPAPDLPTGHKMQPTPATGRSPRARQQV
jgi:hypothetical protein